VALIGEDEIKKGVVTLKDMDGHSQTELPLGELVEKILGTTKQ
jgi:histidyl-tRNA synthetase